MHSAQIPGFCHSRAAADLTAWVIAYLLQQTTVDNLLAEEAFATALYCFLLYADDAMMAIRRAAFSSGDSDSMACIAGAFAGAYRGNDAFSSDWLRRIEYRDDLQHLAAQLHQMHAITDAPGEI